ncbi:hypothetical protein BDP27DRAFT_1505879 [Rhodocollybia butyracea]|uniref:PWWP domain-containing protein n=1 Tax=Rhodocollybia butyracea TaxID=206335 RepID=A0A9P5PW09_9AGAR|nr:hypothetical protein BDP27DRAFT_1505879 [Rhodocollybia butyracea]
MAFSVGDLVLAKQPSFSPWPGRVLEPNVNGKVTIEWFNKSKLLVARCLSLSYVSHKFTAVSKPLLSKNVQHLTHELLRDELPRPVKPKHLGPEKAEDFALALKLLNSSVSYRLDSPLTPSSSPSPEISIGEERQSGQSVCGIKPSLLPIWSSGAAATETSNIDADQEAFSSPCEKSCRETKTVPTPSLITKKDPQVDQSQDQSQEEECLSMEEVQRFLQGKGLWEEFRKTKSSGPMETLNKGAFSAPSMKSCGETKDIQEDDFATMEAFLRGQNLWEDFQKFQPLKGKKLSTNEGDAFILRMEELLKKEVKNTKHRHAFLSRSDGWFTAARQKKAADEGTSIAYHSDGRKFDPILPKQRYSPFVAVISFVPAADHGESSSYWLFVLKSAPTISRVYNDFVTLMVLPSLLEDIAAT